MITIWNIQSINNTLKETKFQNTLTCLEAIRDQKLIEEYAWKSFVLADPGYQNQLSLHQKDFETRLLKLKKNADSMEERTAILRLERLQDSFAENCRLQLRNLPTGGGSLPASLQNDLKQLQSLTQSIYEASLASVSAEVDRSKTTSDAGVMILWCSVFAALASSILVSIFLYRSISKPLAILTEGTRAIAEGKFHHRLDASRNDEFSRLAKDFNTMARRLNELDRLKKDFISHVSHELKAPMASMRGTLQLLLEQIPGPLTDKQKRLVELNLQSEYRLTGMIGNLLDLSRIEAGVMEYDRKNQDLIPLAQTAIAEMEPQAAEKRVQIKTAFPAESLEVECDAARIVQVMVNLIDNAVKFSAKGGMIQVSAEPVRRIPEGIPKHWVTNLRIARLYGLIAVADCGPGIPDSEKENVFDRFHQVKKDKKTAGHGVGLGLTISRTIAREHHGAIWVKDTAGGGSTFLFLLPAGEKGESENFNDSSNL